MRAYDDWQRRSGPYRARNGLLLGVCKGVAEHLDCRVLWIRLIVVLVAMFSALWPVLLIYLLDI